MNFNVHRRLEKLEAAKDPSERLIVVSAPPEQDLQAIIGECGVEKRPRDLVIAIHKPDPGPAWVRIHEAGLRHLIRTIDGRSQPVVRMQGDAE